MDSHSNLDGRILQYSDPDRNRSSSRSSHTLSVILNDQGSPDRFRSGLDSEATLSDELFADSNVPTLGYDVRPSGLQDLFENPLFGLPEQDILLEDSHLDIGNAPDWVDPFTGNIFSAEELQPAYLASNAPPNVDTNLMAGDGFWLAPAIEQEGPISQTF
jgi:hypothetical protein